MSLPPPALQQQEGYSTFFARLVAFVVDALILAFIWQILLQILSIEQQSFGASVVNLVISALYFIYFHAAKAATPGKMIMAMQVVSIDGKGLTYLQSLLRYSPYLVAGVVSLLLPPIDTSASGVAAAELPTQIRVFLTLCACWYTASVVYMLNRTDRRTLHDVLAYTAVIMPSKKP